MMMMSSCRKTYLLIICGLCCCILQCSEALDFSSSSSSFFPLGDKDVALTTKGMISSSSKIVIGRRRRTTMISCRRNNQKSLSSFVPLCSSSSSSSNVRSKPFQRNPQKKIYCCDNTLSIRGFGINGRNKQETTPLVSLNLWNKINSFFRERTGDFVKLENSDDEFGPGPIILLYGCPEGISDDELKEMIEDGAPGATQKHGKVIFGRVPLNDDNLLDSTVSDTLERIVTEGEIKTAVVTTTTTTTAEMINSTINPFPVIYFSGISNREMMQTYQIIAEEIFKETGGAARSACAKVVQPAMGKTLREVFEQITGDHQDAVSGLEPQ